MLPEQRPAALWKTASRTAASELSLGNRSCSNRTLWPQTLLYETYMPFEFTWDELPTPSEVHVEQVKGQVTLGLDLERPMPVT